MKGACGLKGFLLELRRIDDRVGPDSDLILWQLFHYHTRNPLENQTGSHLAASDVGRS